MITLKDTVEIKASPEDIVEFFLNFKENFHAWHPDHVECRYLTSGPLKENSIIYIEEHLHGELHKLKLHITKIQPYSRIEYKTFMGTKGIFIIESRETGTLFTAELHMGTKIPLLGKLVDKIMQMFLSRHLEGLQQHMAEEGQNLKRILEQGTQWRDSSSRKLPGIPATKNFGE
jgi:hypothetical protein